MGVVAIIPAAGRGDRLGPGRPKALREVAGVPMLVYAVQALAQSRQVDRVIVAAPRDELADVRTTLDDRQFPADIEVIPGGDTRQESVRLALESVPAAAHIVIVHDAARPLVPVDIVDAVIAMVRAGAAAAVPVVPVIDTVKEIDSRGLVVRTVDRSILGAVQTPQCFDRRVLEEAHAKAAAEQRAGAVGSEATDDAGLVERLGLPVAAVPGSPEAFKITRPLDLILAEAIVTRRRSGRAQ